ncbi:hypothetical protein C0J52_13747 [Blattella germanica]|nr:hypothetical protein C0J52_13747 [Blattella germanica]
MAKNEKYGVSSLKICSLWHRKVNDLSFHENNKLPSDTAPCQSLLKILNDEKCVQIKYVGIMISKFLKPTLDRHQAKTLKNNNFPKRLTENFSNGRF